MTFLCPVRLTRSGLIGVTARIRKVYGSSPLGVRIYLMWHASVGCKDGPMSMVLASATRRNVAPMANVNGMSCSRRYYERLALSAEACERRELEARLERGEQFAAFARRQAQ